MRLIANGTGSPGGREAYDDTIGSVSDPAEIRVALNKLLDDPAFQASPRNKQFLRFVVEETLAGREARIKSYTIAVDVFGRPTDFDGSIDPIVRIEASRLRTALSNYYGNPSVDPSIKIGLPKGGYIPEFSPIEPTARSAPRENIEPAVDKPPVVDKPPAADKPPAPARPGSAARSDAVAAPGADRRLYPPQRQCRLRKCSTAFIVSRPSDCADPTSFPTAAGDTDAISVRRSGRSPDGRPADRPARPRPQPVADLRARSV